MDTMATTVAGTSGTMRAESYPNGNGKSSGPGAAMTDRTALTDLISTSPAVRRSIRTLVIDDERVLRDSCASILNSEGYHVTTVGKGNEALELLRNRLFDIVLIDLYMSDVPGIELLRAAPPRIPTPSRRHHRADHRIESRGAAARRRTISPPFTGTQLQIAGRAALVIAARETCAQELAIRSAIATRCCCSARRPRSGPCSRPAVAPTNAGVHHGRKRRARSSSRSSFTRTAAPRAH
jgi:hypothetical protein